MNAPVGRWQNGKDLTWYQKDGEKDLEREERERREEIRKVKEAEEDALAVALYVQPSFMSSPDNELMRVCLVTGVSHQL